MPQAAPSSVPPLVLVVMGVSGCGKSTVARLVAERLGWTFADGDDFHAPEHIAKMHAGIPLDDADRAPWLARIAAWIAARIEAREPAVVVCSALRRRYRDLLRGGHGSVRVVYLEGSRALIARRLAERAGHFMPPALLDSQFAALEPPGPDENPITVGIADPPERIAERVVAAVRGESAMSPAKNSAQNPATDAAARAVDLVISDVDGTLVTGDKSLTPATVAAVRRLAAAGIGFTVASSRPPIGLASLVDRLDLRLPMGAFNGASVVGPDLAVLDEALIPEAAAREAAHRIRAAGLDLWVFARGAWWLRDGAAPYTDLERRTLQTEPRVTDDLDALLGAASKLVGVSPDHARLAAREPEIAAALGAAAHVHRSQAYYLDVTPPGRDKGGFVAWMADRLGIPESRIATFGDAGNDRAMFARSGLSVAMGNAEDGVKAAARAVTASNEADGFAKAVEALILR